MLQQPCQVLGMFNNQGVSWPMPPGAFPTFQVIFIEGHQACLATFASLSAVISGYSFPLPVFRNALLPLELHTAG